jgi:nitrite reductase/ring-hydroxylating ferredoxin subunit/DMSO/TMAO reductase YedYZ heme-binding membrane subunit
MSVAYRAVNWNRQKRIYDLVLGIGAPGLVAVFLGVTLARHPTATAETALIRGLAVAAILLLHVILCIGPLCRLSPAFLPLLYNRRHLGVMMCLLAVGHAAFAVFQYHALGDVNPFVSLLSGNQALDSLAGFPFELLGLAALLILVLMAATSHDFWLSVLTPPVWKRLHMLVYAAYALVIAHVALGPVQTEGGLRVALALAAGAVIVIGLHLAAGVGEAARDRDRLPPEEWVDVCAVDEIPENRARIGLVAGERVAVFRYQGMISAVSNVCRHQNGPLGEGRIIDGCITCPWHGYQYRPDTGSSPPPFTDTIPTFRVRVIAGRALVHVQPLPPGTFVEPAVIPTPLQQGDDGPEFYVGYQPASPPGLARHTRRAVVTVTLLLGGTAAVLALAQPPFAAATFEYGRSRDVTGRLLVHPYPALLVDDAPGYPVASRHWLLGALGKHGAAVTGREGRRVRVRGQFIHRGNAAMLEIAGLETLADSGTAAPPPHEDLGVFTLTGEIVDSKCWLGVMNPGEGKTHLACAVRCVSGGLPPMLVIREVPGQERHLLLTDPRGGPMNARILPMVGRPVTVTGHVTREGELLFLRADADAYRVLH